MFKIALSQLKALPFDFEAEVKKHVAALEAHRSTEGEPAPTTVHPWVEAAIGRVQHPVDAGKPDDFVPAYEVVDDSPPPPTLEERKTILANEATALAEVARTAISSPRKRNLHMFQHSDAKTALGALNLQLHLEQISKEQHEILSHPHRLEVAKHDDREAKIQAIHRHLAQLHSDIDDLTETTVDGWVPAPFPT